MKVFYFIADTDLLGQPNRALAQESSNVSSEEMTNHQKYRQHARDSLYSLLRSGVEVNAVKFGQKFAIHGSVITKWKQEFRASQALHQSAGVWNDPSASLTLSMSHFAMSGPNNLTYKSAIQSQLGQARRSTPQQLVCSCMTSLNFLKK